MAICDVLKMGHPLLLKSAEAVTEYDTKALYALIKDMEDTMAAMHGAGLAAPQIGVSLRVVIFGSKDSNLVNPRYPDVDHVPYTILINPVITPMSDVMVEGWEGCLSVPGLRGMVPRYETIHYAGFDPTGDAIERTVTGFHARVVQHECDHLDGMLYPMRVKDFSQFGYIDVLFPNQDIHED